MSPARGISCVKNPYTGIPMERHRPAFRRRCDYGFLAVLVVGLAYIGAYVWPWWPWSYSQNLSGQAVAFFYMFVGGYAFLRSSFQREDGHAGTNMWLAWSLVPVAAWDIASPFFLDPQPLSIVGHLVGGGLALAGTLYALTGYRRESRKEEAGRTVRGA